MLIALAGGQLLESFISLECHYGTPFILYQPQQKGSYEQERN